MNAKNILILLIGLAATNLSAALYPTTNRPVWVQLAWDASTDASVTGYRLWYGVASRNYTNTLDVQNKTTGTISNLLASTRYYFAATAYNAAGLESDWSAEINYLTPDQPRPTNAPAQLHIGTNGITGLTMPFNLETVERSETLSSWDPIGTVFSGADGWWVFVDINPPQWRAFYRSKSS